MAIELGSPRFKGSLRASALLRKTLGSPSRALSAAPEDQKLEHIKNLLKSMVGKGSTQVVQQAQTITKSYTNIHGLYSEDGSSAAESNDHPPERRPALGRKRAKFSLKPKPPPSHSLPNIDFSSSIDHIDDPEEYFLTFEQLENADKELKKLRGEPSTDSVQPHQSTTVRKRRPGLLGKTASYKHHTAADPDTAESLVESQEEHLDRRLPSSLNTSINTGPCNFFHSEPIDKPGTSPAKDTYPELHDAIVTEGSLAKKEKSVSHLLDKLLYSFKDVGGDEGKTFIRESLQIRSIDASKIRLPELGNCQLSQHSASKNGSGELKSSQILPALTKSPLNAISTFERRVSLKDPLKDIYFSFPSDDAPSSGDYSLCKRIQRESLSPLDAGNDDLSGLLTDDTSSPVVEKSIGLDFEDGSHSPVIEADMSIGNNIILEEKITKHPRPSLERKPNPDFNGLANDKGNIADGFDDSLQESHDIQLDPPTNDQPDAGDEGLMLSCGNQSKRKEILDHPTQLLGENTNCDSNAGERDKNSSSTSDSGMQAEGGYMQQNLIMNQPEAAVDVPTLRCVSHNMTESLHSPPSRTVCGNCSISRTNTETGFSRPDDISQSKVDAIVHEKASDAGMSKEILCSLKETVHTDQQLENMRSLPDENSEEHQTVAGPPSNERRKREAPPRKRNKKKPNSRRQSLAGAGMIWEDGRRKSTRRRCRPLEHWRGERLLYGRIHESLSTVIGVKYVSPGNENFKVDSYVSEQYADLVAQVARC